MSEQSKPQDLSGKPRFGLYVHIPYCVHRCSYCDFYSMTDYGDRDFTKLVDAMLLELSFAKEWMEEQGLSPELDTLFLGGGTPSLMPLPEIDRLVECLLGVFPSRSVEVSLEANPETVSENFAKEMAGRPWLTRISMGAQSFSEKRLEQLERLAGPKRIREAFSRLRKNGLTNLNLDLIFAHPDQGWDELKTDLDHAISLGPEHVSFYHLSLKPTHPLFSKLPSSDHAGELYEKGRAYLEEHGLMAYEVSNFSRPGFECRHNLLYWNGGDFLGLGPSAASRFFVKGRFLHKKQSANIGHYLAKGCGEAFVFEETTFQQSALEASFLELRKREGVEADEFADRYGYDLRTSPQFDLFRKEKLLDYENGSIRLTQKGILLADSITEQLVSF